MHSSRHLPAVQVRHYLLTSFTNPVLNVGTRVQKGMAHLHNVPVREVVSLPVTSHEVRVPRVGEPMSEKCMCASCTCTCRIHNDCTGDIIFITQINRLRWPGQLTCMDAQLGTQHWQGPWVPSTPRTSPWPGLV